MTHAEEESFQKSTNDKMASVWEITTTWQANIMGLPMKNAIEFQAHW